MKFIHVFRNYKGLFIIYFKGIFIGVADLVPGISGGTIALITHIYKKLITSLNNFIKIETFTLLRFFQFKKLFYHLNGSFLLPLLAGILTSLFLFSHIISYAFDHYPILLWSFFFGLIMSATVILFKEIRHWKLIHIFFLIFGIIIAWLATTGEPINIGDGLVPIFFSGLIAISAMLLPGISGSFLLILMGKYQTMIEATKNLDFPIIIAFGIGCILSLVLFSKLINWLIKKYWEFSIAILLGFLIGAMHKIWPWREVVTTYLNSSGEKSPLLQKNISPLIYQEITQQDPQIFLSLISASIGIALVITLEIIKTKKSSKNLKN